MVALVGLEDLRRAHKEQGSLTRGRSLLVAGTCGIALLAGAVYWTVFGPVVAVAIVVYWVVKIREWRDRQELAPGAG